MPRNPLATRQAVAARRSLGWTAAGLAAAGLVLGLLIVPPDGWQGPAQRLMYLHVPAAWTAYLAFATTLVASVAYLVRRRLHFDRYARVAAELGVGLTTLTILLGSIWGRLVWGVWWDWDPRLVSTALLLLVYCGYLAARGLPGSSHRTARRAAVVGVAGFALIPVVHFSVVWWRSLHQRATLLAPDASPPIDPLMTVTLVVCLGAFTAGVAWLFLRRLAALTPAVGDPVPVPRSGPVPEPVPVHRATRSPR